MNDFEGFPERCQGYPSTETREGLFAEFSFLFSSKTLFLGPTNAGFHFQGAFAGFL